MNDFDFLLGYWRVHHRRLAVRLAGCDDWVDFEGSADVRAVMGGQANIDDNVLELPGQTYRALTVRTFDPTTGAWSIWWFDSRAPHRLDPPVDGRFEGGIGAFYADDVFEGRPSACVSSGTTSRRRRAGGRRRFPSTPARRGSPTG